MMKKQTKKVNRWFIGMVVTILILGMTAAIYFWFLGGFRALKWKNQVSENAEQQQLSSCESIGDTWFDEKSQIMYSCIPVEAAASDQAFWVATYETTNTQYAACVNAGVCKVPHTNASITHAEYFGNPEFSAYPVTAISYVEAETFCEWTGGSLPTASQWKAAAGIGQETFITNLEDCTVYNGPGCQSDIVVGGSYATDVSPYGVYDMAGNLREWVQAENSGNTLSAAAVLTNQQLMGSSFSDNHWVLGKAPTGGVSQVSTMLSQPNWQDVGFRCVLAGE